MTSQPPLPQQPLNWRREEQIAVPSQDRERRMAIRCSDWDRLKRSLLRSDTPVLKLSVAYSILFGVAATAGLSLIPIALAKDLPSWVAPFYFWLFLFSFVVGCILVRLDKKLRSQRQSDLQDMKTDMDDIESMFETQELQPATEDERTVDGS